MCLGAGRGGVPSSVVGFGGVWVWVAQGSVWWALTCLLFTHLEHSIISMAFVTAPFSYFITVSNKLFVSQPVIFTFFLPPVLFSIPTEKEKRAISEQHLGWSVSVGTLNWGIAFLNHDNFSEKEIKEVIVLNKYIQRGASAFARKRWYTEPKERGISPELPGTLCTVPYCHQKPIWYHICEHIKVQV